MIADRQTEAVMLPQSKTVAAALVLLALAGSARAQTADSPNAAAAAAKEAEPDLQATTAKFNAYVEFMNRTLRAVDSLDRYMSWVNMKTGPTGRERRIYGLYSVYDTKSEGAKATAALTQAPLMPELDAAMRDYIAANDKLAPILNKANAYYERADYKVDKMAEGKKLHGLIVAAAKPFLAARARLGTAFKGEKAKVDMRELAAIEKREGRKADWQVANVMMRAKRVVELLPSASHPIVDMPAFDASLTDFGAAVKDMDDYGAQHPNAFFVFESQPRSLLAKLRDLRNKLAKAKGDARRGGGDDLTWIVNDYNMMVTTSQSATQFNK
jgi:Protein of unknown function (DUF3829)